MSLKRTANHGLVSLLEDLQPKEVGIAFSTVRPSSVDDASKRRK